MQEYLLTWAQLTEKIARFDKRIEELAQLPAYYEKVRKLGCLKGIATHTALSLVVEIGDFHRFPPPSSFPVSLVLSLENTPALKIRTGSQSLRPAIPICACCSRNLPIPIPRGCPVSNQRR